MVSFYFPEYFVGKVSAEGLISVHGASLNLARRYACPQPWLCQRASLAASAIPPRGPCTCLCQRTSATASSACSPALALLTDICPSSTSIAALLPLQLFLEHISPQGGDGCCEMGLEKGNTQSPFWPEQIWNQEQRLLTDLHSVVWSLPEPGAQWIITQFISLHIWGNPKHA